MILHIFPYEKFAYDYISKINALFGKDGHLFYLYGDLPSDKMKSVGGDNVVRESGFRNLCACRLYLSKKAKKAERIILHSWFFPKYIMFLSCYWVRKYPHKVFWNIWGHDLYNMYWNRKSSIKNMIKEILRKYFIKRVRAVGYIPGDYDFLKKHYVTKAKFFLSSYAYEFFDYNEEKKDSQNDVINVMLGNSATKECRYIETIDLLASIDDGKMQIYCVLAYPKNNKSYIGEVSRHGKKIFGDRFVPIVSYMSYDEYMGFLKSIDIAIFNHNRQQGLGNIASLLYLGKKVFVSDENACGDYFRRLGITLFSTNEINCEIKCGLDRNIQINNKKKILEFFSDESFKARWDKIFREPI